MPRASFAGRIFVGNEGDALGVAHQDVQKCSETGFLRRGAVFFRLFAEKLAAQALDLIDSDLELFPTGMLGANSARERERERDFSSVSSKNTSNADNAVFRDSWQWETDSL